MHAQRWREVRTVVARSPRTSLLWPRLHESRRTPGGKHLLVIVHSEVHCACGLEDCVALARSTALVLLCPRGAVW